MKIDTVLLGLIKIHPRISGYQLKTIINESTGYFFQAHLSQIYPRLKQLAEDGRLVFEVVPQTGKPDQKLYTITNEGVETLNGWLREPYKFKKQRGCFDDYVLKFLFMGHLNNEDILRYLDSGIAYFSEELHTLKTDNLGVETQFAESASKGDSESSVRLWRGVMDHLFEETELRIEWLKKTRDTYRV